MSAANKMICPGCGAEMNHHAMKIDYGVDPPDADPVFDGMVNEVHTCPVCHLTELRRSQLSAQ